MREELISQNLQFEPPMWKWVVTIISLSVVSICVGTPNIYATFEEQIRDLIGVSDNLCIFMITAGTFIMYLTLPAGLFIDKFGSHLTFTISVLLTLASYIGMAFSENISWLFIVLYLLGAFGSTSTFLCCQQIVLGRSPPSISTISVSMTGAALSLSAGIWIQVFYHGEDLFPCQGNCTIVQLRTVILFLSILLALSSVIAFFFYRQFRETKQSTYYESSGQISYCDAIMNPKLYLLMVTIFLCVFDGLTILNGGPKIWEYYGYKDGQITYITLFSIINSITTMVLSVVIDLLIHKFSFSRIRIFSCLWLIFISIHIFILVLFNFSHSKLAFGIATSLMGIPFGVGLANIPAITFEIFGYSNYGFAFGIVQVGSLIAAAITMPIESHLSKIGISIILIVQIILHILTSILIFISKKQTIVSDLASFHSLA